jgi:DNA polymerase III, beta subunit
MRLSCLQENLKKGLATVSHAVAGKSTLPVLSNVLLATDRGRLKLAATNLEVGITCWIGAKVEEEGAVTVPAKLLSDVIGSLPNDRVTLALDPRTVTAQVTCARFNSNIKGIEAEEFPAIPTISDQEPTVTLAPDVLRETIDQVAFAAASDDSRPVLAGVLIRLKGEEATFAATDGFRLAKRTITLAEPVENPQEFIVPARTLSELSRILGDTEGNVEITVTPSGGQVLFHTENTDLVSRLIDGKFPDFERIIPTTYATRSVFDTQEMIKAVKLASFFANASQSTVKCSLEPGGEIGPGKLIISANAAEVGDNTGELDGMVQGEGGPIALNVRYLQDALAAIKTPQVAFETQTPRSPGVFKPVGQDGYVHLVMPMTVR